MFVSTRHSYADQQTATALKTGRTVLEADQAELGRARALEPGRAERRRRSIGPGGGDRLVVGTTPGGEGECQSGCGESGEGDRARGHGALRRGGAELSPRSRSLGAVVAPPRLPAETERRIVKRVCDLSPRVQRRLFGKPPTLDGQTLATDVHALIKLAESAGSESITGNATPARARQERRRDAKVTQPGTPIPMERVAGLQIPGPAGPIATRHYLPRGTAAPAPLLLYFHGGGWVVGDLDTHDGVCRFLAATSGVAVLSVDYRLAPEHPFPAAVEDAWAAFAWLAANAASLGADPGRIAVGGDSAGANLAAVLCLLAREAGLSPALQLLIYPIADVATKHPSRQLFAEGFLLTDADMEWFEGHYIAAGTDRADPRISPLRAPDLSRLPPAYVATAGFDPLRDEGEAYALGMREAGVPVALVRHPGLTHTFANLTALSRSSRAAMLEAAGALRMGLADPSHGG
jgi:acetyl esterase